MADDYNNEVFMRLLDMNGKPILAECRTEVSSDDDDLIYDYENGEFFAVDDFKIGANVEDEDAATDAGTAGGSGKQDSNQHKLKQKAPAAKFAKWKSATPAEVKNMKFQLKLDDLSITRRYDRASPVLFRMCARSEVLRSASVVKRKIVGDHRLQTFLRYDFKDLLVSRISFEDDEVIKETVQFVFRDIKVTYKTQEHDGSLGDAINMYWGYDAKTRKTGPSK
jgi:type VI protein secretion system component Hcp